MATITSEIVTEYFSELNLRWAPFIMFDEFVIPQYLNTNRISMTPVGTQMFELCCCDYYKFTMNQLIKKHDKK